MEWIKNHWFLLTMLAIATILSFVWLFVFNRKRLNAKWWEIIIISFIHTIYGVLTVLFFAFFESGFKTSSIGNISLFGGIFFMPIMYAIYALIKKLPIGLVFDVFVISLAATLALARVNCLYAGCCIGIEIGNNGFIWPAREIDILIHVLFLIFAIPVIYKGHSKGKGYPIYMIAYGGGRFLNEWLRESGSSSPFHIGHVWALISLIIGTTWLVITLLTSKRKGAISYEND